MFTQSIKYTGSKLKLLTKIDKILEKKDISFLDGFSGSTRVSQYFAYKGNRIICNDISEWSYILGNCYLNHNHSQLDYYKEILDHLNSLKPHHGWFSEHYGSKPIEGIKKPFQLKNTKKLDSIREEIDNLNLDFVTKTVVLTSLLLGLDKVDNTVGHYVSYLKKWSKRSYQDLYLELPELVRTDKSHKVLKQDVKKTLKEETYDVVYLDPPYGSNNNKMPSSRVRYESYYHIWKTIILNDKPQLFGKSNRREDSRDKNSYNVYEDYKKTDGVYNAEKEIENIISLIQCEEIIFSYSSTGRVPFENLLDIFNSYGVVNVYKMDYKKNVMSSMKKTGLWTDSKNDNLQEFIFHIKKKI